jgi:hypothetical protein
MRSGRIFSILFLQVVAAFIAFLITGSNEYLLLLVFSAFVIVGASIAADSVRGQRRAIQNEAARKRPRAVVVAQLGRTPAGQTPSRGPRAAGKR